MTEPIKQEIVSCIYENGEQLITGPVLQEVLVDMVDDYNEKISSGSLPSDLIEKTGSWDSASAWVEDNKDDLVHTGDLDGYATEGWVEAKHYLTTASLSGSVTEETVGFMIGDATASVKEWVEEKNYATETFVSESIAGIDIPDVSGYLPTASFNPVSASFDERINAITGSDLSGYATTESLNSVSQSISQSINGLADTVNGKAEARDLTSLSESVANDFANLDISGLATTESLNTVSESISASLDLKADKSDIPSLEGYATEAWVQEQGYLTEHQDISGLATTQSVTQLSESVAQTIESLPQTDLSGYLQTSSYLVDSASFDSRIKDAREEATAAITSVSEGVVALSASFDSRINDITGSDLSGYATTESVNQLSSSVATDIQNARTEASQAITGLGTIVQGESDRVTGLSASFDDRINNITGSSVDLSGYATTASVNQLSSSVSSDILNARTEASAGFASVDQGIRGLSASFDQRINDITGSSVDLSGYLTTASFNQVSESVDERLSNHQEAIEALEGAGTLYWDEDHWSATDKVDRQEFDDVSASFDQRIDAIVPPDLSIYATTASVNQVSESLSQSIAAITSSGSGDNIWQRGTGTSSIQMPGNAATGNNSLAHGYNCSASGDRSHAEGRSTKASGDNSHAEGYSTEASGAWSHAEGYNTKTAIAFEHAEGICNATASGQIFSIGIGHNTASRKNAISVIRDYSGTNPSASVYVYGVGGYVGNNPQPGVNDLITVLTQGGFDTASYMADSASFNQRISYLYPKLWTTGSGKNSIVREEQFADAGEDAISLASGKVLNVNYYRCEYGTWAPQPSENNPKYYLSHEVSVSQWTRVQVGQYLAPNYSPEEVVRVVEKGEDPTYGHYIVVSRFVGYGTWFMLVDPAIAEGTGSLVQGLGTQTTNTAELATGKYNTTASNQIFSIGVGDSSDSRKNAVSIITGSNSSASVYVYGVGGYVGNNPQPGINDLATAISLISGSGLTSETWTFVLEDSSSVTKNIVVA